VFVISDKNGSLRHLCINCLKSELSLQFKEKNRNLERYRNRSSDLANLKSSLFESTFLPAVSAFAHLSGHDMDGFTL
jgi:hypothetical protein